MDCMEKLYEELKNNNSRMGGQIIGGLVIEILLGYVPMMYPVGFLLRGDHDAAVFMGISVCMLMVSLFLYLRAYTVIEENGEVFSIAEKLRYIPVSIKVIKNYLQKYLKLYCLRVFVIGAVIQFIGNWIAKTGVVIGVLYAALVAAVLWGMGYYSIIKIIKIH